MTPLFIYCRIFVFIYCFGYAPTWFAFALAQASDPRIYEPPPLITPAPEILKAREVNSTFNYVEGWSVVGRKQEPANPFCLKPATINLFTKGKELLASCLYPGVKPETMNIVTMCLDYQSQGSVQTPSGTSYCSQTSPYCATWLWDAGSSMYSAVGCATKPSLTLSYTKTGDGPPYITSSLASNSGSRLISAAETPEMTSTPTSSIPSSTELSSTVFSPTVKALVPSSSSTNVNFALPIAWSLGGVCVLVVGGVAIYICLMRKRRKTTDNLRASRGSLSDDVEAKKWVESMSLASKTDHSDRFLEKYTLRATDIISKVRGRSRKENQPLHVQKGAEEGEVDTWFEMENPNEHDILRGSDGPRGIDAEEEKFKWDIKIIDSKGIFRNATALLDTQCQIGNWISLRLVQRLDKVPSISTNFTPPDVSEASGGAVSATGVIELEWKRVPGGNRVHQSQFYVYSTSGEIDVIFGVEYIVKERLLEIRQNALVPLVEHKKAGKNSKAAIAIAKEKQRQEKAALEARRAEEAAQSQSQGQYQQNQDQNQDQHQGRQW